MHSQTILVTGFPSNFLARHVVPDMLRTKPKTRHVFLVRESDIESANALLRTSGHGQSEVRAGDVTSIDFGLAGAEYMELAESVGEIHHLAAVNYSNANAKLARQVNIVGTQELIEFARTCKRLTDVVHWSTAMISGTRTGTIHEDDFRVPNGFRSEIEATRFEAERLLRSARLSARLTIFRPTQIVGDSQTGAHERVDGLYLVAKLLCNTKEAVPLPLPRLGDRPLHLVPIDYVVQLASSILKNDAARGKTYHLADRHPSLARDVFVQLAEIAGRPRPQIILPPGLLSRVLSTPGLGRYLSLPKAFLDIIATDVHYDDRNVRVAVPDVAPCPPPSVYLRHVVDAVR